jgi:hypothetical protein
MVDLSKKVETVLLQELLHYIQTFASSPATLQITTIGESIIHPAKPHTHPVTFREHKTRQKYRVL